MIETVEAAGNDYAAPAAPGWRGRDWSEFVRRVEIAGSQLNLCDVGSGTEACLLVHGMGGRWQHWLENIPFLSQHRRVVALDLPGFGRSEPPKQRPSAQHFADCIAELCRARNIGRAVLFGHSMGGPIALQFASRHPDLAEAIVLVAGPVFSFSRVLSVRGAPEVARRSPTVAAAIVTGVVTAGLPTPRFVRHAIATRPNLRRLALWPCVKAPELLPSETAELLVGGAGVPGVFPTARAVGKSEPLDNLDQVTCPILSINGANDLIVPREDVERFAEIRPDAEVVLIQGVGHMLMLERPAAFNRIAARAIV